MRVLLVQGLNTLYSDTYANVQRIFPEVVFRYFYTTRDEPLSLAVKRLVDMLKDVDAIWAHSMGAMYLRLALGRTRFTLPIVLSNAVLDPRNVLSGLTLHAARALRALRTLAGDVYVPTFLLLPPTKPLTYLQERSAVPNLPDFFMMNLTQLAELLLQVDGLRDECGELWADYDVRVVTGSDDSTANGAPSTPSHAWIVLARHEPFNDAVGVQAEWRRAMLEATARSLRSHCAVTVPSRRVGGA
jgi:hypothetical protein